MPFFPEAADLPLYALTKASALSRGAPPEFIFSTSPKHLQSPTVKAAVEAIDPTGLVSYGSMSATFLASMRQSVFVRMYNDKAFNRAKAGRRAAIATSVVRGSVLEAGSIRPVSKLNFGSGILKPHEATALLAVSRELLDASAENANLLGDAARAGVGTALDSYFLEGIVTSSTPTFASSGITAEDALVDLRALLAAVNTSTTTRLYFVGSVDVANYYATLEAPTASGSLAFPCMTPKGGELLGIPFLISDELETGTLMLIDAAAFAADVGIIKLDFSESAALQMDDAPDGAGELVSMFQTFSVAIKASLPFAYATMHDSAVAVIHSVGVGA